MCLLRSQALEDQYPLLDQVRHGISEPLLRLDPFHLDNRPHTRMREPICKQVKLRLCERGFRQSCEERTPGRPLCVVSRLKVERRLETVGGKKRQRMTVRLGEVLLV